MIGLILFFWTFLCPNPTHTPQSNCPLEHIIVSPTGGDTGGETGNFPPKPPVPPPPPPPLP